MVYLSQEIARLRSILRLDQLPTLAYYFIRQNEILGTIDVNNFSGQEKIAAKGYLSLPLTDEEIKELKKPPYQGVDMAHTIFKLLGGYLADHSQLESKVKQKFAETSLKNKYFISLALPVYEEEFRSALMADNSDKSWIIHQVFDSRFDEDNFNKLAEYLQGNMDVIDLLMLEDLLAAQLKVGQQQALVINKDAYNLIVDIFGDFHNCTKKTVL